MGRGFGRSAGLVLTLSAPGGVILAALSGTGLLDARTALLAGAALLALTALLAIPFVLSLAATRAAIGSLAPDAATNEVMVRGNRRRLSLAARDIWPAL